MTTRTPTPRLRDHVITCDQRFQRLELRIQDLEHEIQGLRNEIQHMHAHMPGPGRPGVVAWVAVAVALAAVALLVV